MTEEVLVVNNKYGFKNMVWANKFYAGTREDVQTLYFRFRQENDLSFASFCKAWKELKFASVFVCRKRGATELMEYCQGLIHYGKSYLLSTKLSVCLFGLYFIYAVYHKQPFSWKPGKLRLTLTELKELTEILKKLDDNGHAEVYHIYKCLHDIGGIHYVVSSLETGIERGFVKYFGNVEEEYPITETDGTNLDESLLENLETVQKLYCDMKKKVIDDNEVTFFESSNIVTMIKGRLAEVSERFEREKYLTTGDRRRKLKSAAFKKGSTIIVDTREEEGKQPGRGRKILERYPEREESSQEESKAGTSESLSIL